MFSEQCRSLRDPRDIVKHCEALEKHHETLLKHYETHVKHRKPLLNIMKHLKHCKTSLNTQTLAVRCDDICGDAGTRHGDIRNCGVAITPQMCNRVTNP